VLAACGGSRGGSAGAGAAPTLAQVSAVLARHAGAVRHHSSAAFLADVDSARVAAGFRNRQRAQIDDLATVPLRSWSYAVSAPVTDRAALAAGAKRLGAPVRIVHLTVSYALTGVDPQPSSHDLWWTFVRRHGRVVVAADDDMAQLGGVSWTGPWDYGPVVAVRASAGLVLGHPSDAARLPRVAAAVDAAVPAVSAVWGTRWARRVAVFVPASSPELTALAGTGTTLTDISALAVFDAADADARLVLNSTALAALTPVGLDIVLRHEITHIASAAATGASLPRWLIEGFADYVANLGSGQPVRVAARELRTDLAHGVRPAALPTDAAFAPGGARLAQTYEQAWLACRLVAARAGPDGLVRLYRIVGASTDAPAAAVAAAVRAVLHESVAAFTGQWRDYLNEQLG
jgi:hypothetical protein